MRFLARASVGNADGVFDAAYDFGAAQGAEAEMFGTPDEIGTELVRFLSGLSLEDCQAMQYGTGQFFIEIVITPEHADR